MGIFPNDINMKVWFYNFENKEWQHSQLWEFEQQAEGKKEEERSSREQKTQEDHVSPSTAFLGNFGDNCDNTTSDETNRSLLEVSLAARQSSAWRATDAGDYIK